MAQTRFFANVTAGTTVSVDPGTTPGTITLTVVDTTPFSGLASFPYPILLDWGGTAQEVMNVTARPSSTTFTAIRAQDGTTAVAHPIGTSVYHGVSAREFNEANAHINASAGVHGITGSVVGTTDTQTMSGKTLTAPVITDFTSAAHTHNPQATANGGLVAMPCVSVFRSAALTLSATAGTMTLVPWDGEEYEDNVVADAMHSTVTNPSRLIAPYNGKYLLLATVEMSGNATAPYLRINAQKNNAGVNGTAQKWSTGPGSAGASNTNNVALATPLKLLAGDYIEIFVSSSLASHGVAVGQTTTYASMTMQSG